MTCHMLSMGVVLLLMQILSCLVVVLNFQYVRFFDFLVLLGGAITEILCVFVDLNGMINANDCDAKLLTP